MPYVIKKTQPFVIKGQKKDYLIPALTTLSTEQVGDVLALTTDTPVAERVAAVKSFLLRMAPDLADEELGDVGYSMIFAAYEKEQDLGK